MQRVEGVGMTSLVAHPAEMIGGRIPPHDREAEQSVLGALMLDSNAVAQVRDILDLNDFYEERHAHIYRAAVDLSDRGEPIDIVTLRNELERDGALARSGGVDYIAELSLVTPAATSVRHYAEIVIEHAVRRRLIRAGGEIAAYGYDDSLTAEEATDRAEQRVFTIATQRRTSEASHIAPILKDTWSQLESLLGRRAFVTGVPTNFGELDKVTQGLQPGELIILAARPSVGKALALDTPIPTPRGWTTMGALRAGDRVFDERGRPCTVTFATEVMRGRECFEVVFSDGSVIVADAEHLWATSDRAARKRGDETLTVRTTRELRDSMRTPDGRANHLVPACGALEYPERDLAVDPSTLGLWLAGALTSPATVRVARSGWERVEAIPVAAAAGATASAAAAREARGAGTGLAAQGDVRGDAGLDPAGRRRIPRLYLEASAAQRLALLQGLMAGDRRAGADGVAEFSSTSARLADDVFELATSLGIVPSRSREGAPLADADAEPRHRVTFTTGSAVSHLERRRARLRPRRAPRPSRSRRIRDIRPVASVPVRCITVDSPGRLYLAGRACIPTHNTSFALNVARNASVLAKQPVVVFSLEMSKDALVQRLLCSEAAVDAFLLKTGQADAGVFQRIAHALNRLMQAELWIDDTPGLSITALRARARRMKAQHDIRLVVVDYLQLMRGGRTESRVQEVSDISAGLKSIAKELGVPVLALSQLSRESERRTDRRPQLSDLRDSGCLVGSTPVFLPDEGRCRPIGTLVGSSGFRVLALDTARWRLAPGTVSNVFPTGRRPVFDLTTRLGRSIRATGNHRFLTIDGWRRLDELAPTDRIALPRKLPTRPEATMTDDEIALLGHLIGDGCTLPQHVIQYTTSDLPLAETVADLARSVFGERVRPRIRRERTWYQVYLPTSEKLTHGRQSPIAAWLRGLGAFGLRSHEKLVPDRIFEQPAQQIAMFLRHLWATDGCIHQGRGVGRIYYASSSLNLARDVQSLLLRLGITARVRGVSQSERGRRQHHVVLSGQADVLSFLDQVGPLRPSAVVHAAAIRASLRDVATNTNRDVIPRTAWRNLALPALALAGGTQRSLSAALGVADNGSALFGANLGRARAERVAEAVHCDELRALATSDVYWDRVAAIELAGEEDVYDLTVDGLHNFVAADIVVHNSIEQDADIVLFLYREGMHNQEIDRSQTKLIVGKNRNGPIGDIDLVFVPEQTSFREPNRGRGEG